MAKPIDITGQRFGLLTAKRLIPQELRTNSYGRREWECICDCGNTVIVEQRFLTLEGKQHVSSCGCLRVKAHLIATSGCQWLTLNYCNQFEDWDKFIFLHKQVVKTIRVKDGLTQQYYESFIERFYFDEQFNSIYNNWISNKQLDETFYDWRKPSVDHIVPLSRGGSHDIDNLQFLTVYENLNKRDMTEEEWENFKRNTHTSSDLFIRR